jgi:hypothetical protein
LQGQDVPPIAVNVHLVRIKMGDSQQRRRHIGYGTARGSPADLHSDLR